MGVCIYIALYVNSSYLLIPQMTAHKPLGTSLAHGRPNYQATQMDARAGPLGAFLDNPCQATRPEPPNQAQNRDISK